MEETNVMMEEPKKKKKGVPGVLVFFLLLIFTAGGLVGGWYVGDQHLIKIGTEKEEKEEEKEVEEEEEEELKVGECLNCKDGNKYTLTGYSNIGLSIEINSDMKSTNIKANVKDLGSAYGLTLTSLGDNEYITEVKVDGFDKKITQAHIGGFGQAAGLETILYVLEDGTVEYTPVLKDIQENWKTENKDKLFKSHNKVKDVKDVSYITGASVTAGTTGYYTTLAVKKDGSFYDLDEILNRK